VGAIESIRVKKGFTRVISDSFFWQGAVFKFLNAGFQAPMCQWCAFWANPARFNDRATALRLWHAGQGMGAGLCVGAIGALSDQGEKGMWCAMGQPAGQ
jgi:hypothetical protein